MMNWSAWSKIQQYDLYVCFDGSRISALSSGVVAGPTERGRWYFRPAEEDDETDGEEQTTGSDERGKEADESVEVYEIVSVDAVSALKTFLTGTGESASTSQEDSSSGN